MIDALEAIFTAIPIWLWLVVPASIVFVLSAVILKDLKISGLLAVSTAASFALIILFLLWLEFLENHFLGSYDANGLPGQFSASGWRLFFISWKLWLPPALLTAVVALGIVRYANWFDIVDEPDEDTLAFTPSQPGTQDILKSKFENEKLKKQLAVAEEKFRILSERAQQLSPKDTRTMLDVKQLREQLVACKKEKTALAKEIDLLNNDLDRTNHLVDQLLEEKYGSD